MIRQHARPLAAVFLVALAAGCRTEQEFEMRSPVPHDAEIARLRTDTPSVALLVDADAPSSLHVVDAESSATDPRGKRFGLAAEPFGPNDPGGWALTAPTRRAQTRAGWDLFCLDAAGRRIAGGLRSGTWRFEIVVDAPAGRRTLTFVVGVSEHVRSTLVELFEWGLSPGAQ